MPAMSKPQTSANVVVRVTFLILMGLVALLFYPFAPAVIVPVMGWFIWRQHDRVAELEAKLAPPMPPMPLEKKPDDK